MTSGWRTLLDEEMETNYVGDYLGSGLLRRKLVDVWMDLLYCHGHWRV